jgi:cytochrome c553
MSTNMIQPMKKTRLESLVRQLAAPVLMSCGLLAGVLAPAAAAAPFEDTMAQRTLACTACHGPQGRAAPDGYYPRLAGKPAGYLYNQLLNFREGRRHYGLMTGLIDSLSDAYLLEMAQYFSSLEVPYPAPLPSTAPAEVLRLGRQLATQGDASRKLPACVQCHGQAMTGVAPGVPGLLGLPRDYLNAQLGAWKAGQRRAHAPDCMKQVVDRLSLEDIHAVSSWIAAQPLPADTHPATSLPVPPPGGSTLDCGSASLPASGMPGMVGTKAQK